jgi:excisionase family DNA binding protein
LSVSERTLWGLTKAGKVPFVRLGKAVRYPVHLLRKWLEEQAQATEVAAHE